MDDLAGRCSTEAIQIQLAHTLLTLSSCLREDVTSHGECSEGALAVRRTPECLHLVEIVLAMLFGTTDLHASSTKEKCPLDRIHAAQSVMNRVQSRLLSVSTNLLSEKFIIFIVVQITELATKSILWAGRQLTNFLVQPSLPPEEFLRLFDFFLLLLDVLFLPRPARFFAACSLHARGSLHDVCYRCNCPRNVRSAVAVEPKHFATLCCHSSKVASHPGPGTNRSSDLGGTHLLLHIRNLLDVKHLKRWELLRKAPCGQLGEASVAPEVRSPGMQCIQGCLCLCTGCSHLHAGILHRRWTISKRHVAGWKAARRAGVVWMLAELPVQFGFDLFHFGTVLSRFR
mmetsp:Transcript_58028/g.135821  ORF Transcript_58028/g.135821 Transcript_58028/m.135821 type:complete len:343 (-) Transcript_58028:207-1235(-)